MATPIYRDTTRSIYRDIHGVEGSMRRAGQTITASQVIAEERDYFAAQRAGHTVSCEEYSKQEMPHYCKEATADSLAWSTLSDFVSKSVLGFLLCPVIGAAGDIYGRKPFMVVACVANVLVASSLVLYKHRGLPFYWYYVAHAILEAVTAAPTALAALSDCVSPQNRVKCFGLLLACMSFGVMLGPVIGKEVGERRTFEVSLMWTLCTVIFSLIFLKETVPHLQVNMAPRSSDLVQPLLAAPAEVAQESREGIPLAGGSTNNEFQTAASSCWRNAAAKLPTLAGIKILLRNKLFRTLALCVVINGIVSEGMHDTVNLYLQQTLAFTTSDRLTLMMALGVSSLVVQSLLLPLLVRFMHERQILLIGVGVTIIQELGIALATEAWQASALMILGTVSFVIFPAVGTLKANAVGKDEQGQIQGALYGAQSMGQGIGPLLFSGTYQLFTTSKYGFPHFPAAPFILGTMFATMGFLVALKVCRDHKPLFPRSNTGL
ncbi:hypothetical protein CYMTET_9680 [Cymbomonas tetramitiformis]|uniref:Major facilitator superfamily (MFS) profile domain-containing protein n=1 Tax=Cymbomonas tetramitiformis TaxID=36881 RepID=A0AAE0GS90_9CHLO|nr:hypothetical protein CYMTET_9680 [Cymbomonas tetramitiformis]